jgi:hypothetical protein
MDRSLLTWSLSELLSSPTAVENSMAKSQKRSNREAKKPKAVKPKPSATSSTPSVVPGSTAGRKPAKRAR